MTIINLADYRSGGSLVFAGRLRGGSVRERARIDELDEGAEQVTVVVPGDTLSVNSSFFLGMFEKSIKKLGRKRFLERYKFAGADIEQTVDDGIENALKRHNPLPTHASG